MVASELLSEIVPAIHKNDKAKSALNWMDVFKVSHLPIVDGNEYLGVISDADIFDMNNPEALVSEHILSLHRVFVKEYQHVYEVAEVVAKNRLSLIPVLSTDEVFLGVITAMDLGVEFSHLMSCESPGAIIVLEMREKDYTLSAISQIVEGNDVKILSLYVKTLQGTDRVELSLKVNKTDVQSVIQTFERFSYKIKEVHAESKEIDASLKDRLDSFLNFLNI